MPQALRINMPHGSACWMVGEAVQYLYQVSPDHNTVKLLTNIFLVRSYPSWNPMWVV